ncbi:hypothetical protein JB92DRAFT_3118798 [Gautieria morchelliformis]|nr:hypothetical protein JB92DRAFT_3118798 [Gautieria morchelliformis]
MKKLSSTQHAVLEPACLLAKKSAEVVIGVPGLGAMEIFYLITGTDHARVEPHKLARHLSWLDITLHCLCILGGSPCPAATVANPMSIGLASTCRPNEHRISVTLNGPHLTLQSSRTQPAEVGAMRRQRKATSHIRPPYLPPHACPSIDKAIEKLVQSMRDDQGEHYLTLSPTLSTSSVEAYRMSSDHIPWNLVMPASRNGPTLSPGPSTPATRVHPHAPGDRHSEGAHKSKPTSRYECIVQEADNEFVGIMEWECSRLFEKCDRCPRWFSTQALHAHIPTHD